MHQLEVLALMALAQWASAVPDLAETLLAWWDAALWVPRGGDLMMP